MYHGERGRALHGADGHAEKTESEGKGGGSLRGEKMSGRTALSRRRRCRVLSSGREETAVLPANGTFIGRTDSRIWVGGGKNHLQRKTAHEESGAAKLI